MTLRALVLFLHIIAACVWIGGQITVAAVVPLLADHPDLRRRVAARFGRVAWSAFALLVVTGIGNVLGLGLGWSQLVSTHEGRLVLDKLGFVALSGAAAAAHTVIQSTSRRERIGERVRVITTAVLGSLSLLAALAAALYGVVIARGGQ